MVNPPFSSMTSKAFLFSFGFIACHHDRRRVYLYLDGFYLKGLADLQILFDLCAPISKFHMSDRVQVTGFK
jgi:hypothetical protein